MEKTILIAAEPTPTFPNGVEVKSSLALRSVTLKNMIEDFGGVDSVSELPVPLVGGNNNDTLALIFRFLEEADKNGVVFNEAETMEWKSVTPPWETAFFDAMPMKTRFNFILLSSYLDIKQALLSVTRYVASLIKGKKADEIRKLFAVTDEPISAQ